MTWFDANISSPSSSRWWSFAHAVLEIRLRVFREQSHEDRGVNPEAPGHGVSFRNVAISNGGCAGGILACNVPKRE